MNRAGNVLVYMSSAFHSVCVQRRKVRPPGLTLSQDKTILSETLRLLDPCLCVCCVRGGCCLCCILGEAGSPLWMGARSQSHTAGLFIVEGCTGWGSEWSRCNMTVISVPSREACLWTFSVNRADGYFVFCLFDFKEKLWEWVSEKNGTCLYHVSKVKNVKKTTWQH